MKKGLFRLRKSERDRSAAGKAFAEWGFAESQTFLLRALHEIGALFAQTVEAAVPREGSFRKQSVSVRPGSNARWRLRCCVEPDYGNADLIGVREGARDFFGRLYKKSAGLLAQGKGFWCNMTEKDPLRRAHRI